MVGRALLPALTAAGHQIAVAVRRADHPGLPPGLFVNARVHVVGEIGPDTEWGAALHGADAVAHLAARVHVMKEGDGDPLMLYCRVNAEGTARLATAALAAGVKRFVLVSTVKVMGESDRGRPLKEDETPAPADAYGLSKWAGEKALLDVCRQGRMQPVILRPPLAYGPGVKGNMLRLLKLLKWAPPLPLAAIDNRRSLISAGNLADAIVCCLVHPKAGGVYFVRDAEDVSTPELVRRLGAAIGRPARLFPLPEGVLRLAAALSGQPDAAARLLDSLRVDDTKIRRDLGWTPPHDMVQGLGEMASWFASPSAS
jgi:nucleoside-diphosphate-sugar epimerase